MELQLLNDTFSPNESIEILNQLFQVKIKFHEDKIKMSQNEEDVKMRERKIKFLQNELAEARQFISTKSGYISLSSQIIL
jgi:cob(I)alamin adenosyltransferase